MPYSIAIHGGSGHVPRDMSEEDQKAHIQTLREAVESGLAVLKSGGSSLDAVESAVRVLEGRGSVFTSAGTHEMDASIMDGNQLRCGAVGGVSTIKNPISLARRVMEHSPHIFFVAEGAEKFAREQGFEVTPVDYFFDERRWAQLQDAKKHDEVKLSESTPEERNYKKGTVGAVALDVHGNLAAATSTGGMTNKAQGRIGDSPIIGAGTYAANGLAAVSGTGVGEQFIRNAVAHSVVAAIEYGHLDLQQACNKIVNEKLRKDDGGVIAVDAQGNISMIYNTEGMFRACAKSESEEILVKIWE